MQSRQFISASCIIALLILCASPALRAQESNGELAKAAQNPLANMISLPFQDNINFDYGPNEDRTQNVLNIQPVIPLFGGRLITRTIFPVLWQPDFAQESGTKAGLADVNFTAFYSPASNGAIWGIGPILTIPTSYDYSSKKWGIGPSFVILKMTPKWVYGFLANNVWSVAGDEDRADVNKGLLQPFLNYNFPGGKYLSFSPIITVDWEAESGQQWTVPLGLSAGAIVRLGKLPINLQAGAYANVVKPDVGPGWQARLQAVFLFPMSMFSRG